MHTRIEHCISLIDTMHACVGRRFDIVRAARAQNTAGKWRRTTAINARQCFHLTIPSVIET